MAAEIIENRLLEKGVSIDTLNTVLALSKINFQCKLTSGLIVGSLAKGLFEVGVSDVDLLFLYADDFNEEKLVNHIELAGYHLVKCNELYTLNRYENQIHVCYKNFNEFIGLIKNIIDGKEFEAVARSWVIGGEVKDVLLLDLTNAIILFNKDANLEKIFKKINESNTEFFKKSILFFTHEISEKIKLCKSAIENGDSLLVIIGFGEIISLLSRMYCARHKVYNPGLKHLTKSGEFVRHYKLKEFLLGDYNVSMIAKYVENLELILDKDSRNKNIRSNE